MAASGSRGLKRPAATAGLTNDSPLAHTRVRTEAGVAAAGPADPVASGNSAQIKPIGAGALGAVHGSWRGELMVDRARAAVGTLREAQRRGVPAEVEVPNTTSEALFAVAIHGEMMKSGEAKHNEALLIIPNDFAALKERLQELCPAAIGGDVRVDIMTTERAIKKYWGRKVDPDDAQSYIEEHCGVKERKVVDYNVQIERLEKRIAGSQPDKRRKIEKEIDRLRRLNLERTKDVPLCGDMRVRVFASHTLLKEEGGAGRQPPRLVITMVDGATDVARASDLDIVWVDSAVKDLPQEHALPLPRGIAKYTGEFAATHAARFVRPKRELRLDCSVHSDLIPIKRVENESECGPSTRVGKRSGRPFGFAQLIADAKKEGDRRREFQCGTTVSRDAILKWKVNELIEQEQQQSRQQRRTTMTASVLSSEEERTRYFKDVMRMCDAGRKLYSECRDLQRREEADCRDKGQALPPEKCTFIGLFGDGDSGFAHFESHAHAVGFKDVDGVALRDLWDYGPSQWRKLTRPRHGDLPEECMDARFRERCIAELRQGGTGFKEPAHPFQFTMPSL